MKRKVVTVILGSAIMLAVIACGKDETVETMNTDTVVEENVSDKTVVEENVTEEVKEELEEDVYEPYDPLSQDNIIQLDDGTYDFTDDFLGTVMSYDYFAGSTEQEVKDYLNEVIDIIIVDRSPEEISESLGALGFSTGSTLKQDTTNQNTSSSVGEDSQSGGNNSNSGNGESSPTEPPVQSTGGTGNSGVVTDPNAGFSNLDPAIWGNVDTDTSNFGQGGELIEPDNWNLQ